MNHDCPDVNEEEHANIQPFLHGENVDKQVIWNRLEITIKRMESMGSERSWDNPLVVRL
jgi:hypothetical protein